MRVLNVSFVVPMDLRCTRPCILKGVNVLCYFKTDRNIESHISLVVEGVLVVPYRSFFSFFFKLDLFYEVLHKQAIAY